MNGRLFPPASVEEDDVITFTEQEIDRTCRAGEEGRFGSDGPVHPQLRSADRWHHLPCMPEQGSRDPMRITPAERAAAALGCPTWELELCAECGS
ncbi:hypothetical protein [Streptomyces sp. bgisy034]|uniref:hypothetical protein n=1 Tax=Streptomyces sp. bgisy034 TaxID=3413774 RepID=UPI003EB93C07